MLAIPDLLRARTLLQPGAAADAFFNIFEVREERARCVAPAPLAAKYGVQADNAQSVVAVRNRYSQSLTFWNPARTAKPQTFVAARAPAEDPTVGRVCDFCSWRELTAADTFGRVENEYAVSASNLFKFTQHHGLILFKHHDPLTFSEPQLGGLLSAAQGWVHETRRQHASAAHPTLLWNALPRAGASQFHGHAQVTMSESETPFPQAARAVAAAAAYAAAHPMRAGRYAVDVAAAHGALGLRRTLRHEGSTASAYACIAPLKDCECVVRGASVGSPAFVRLLHLVLRTLLDRCGVATFNATVSGMSLEPHAAPPAEACEQGEEEEEHECSDGAGVIARVVSRGHLASRASDYGALEVFGGASIGHTSPWALVAALDTELAARSLQWAR